MMLEATLFVQQGVEMGLRPSRERHLLGLETRKQGQQKRPVRVNGIAQPQPARRKIMRTGRRRRACRKWARDDQGSSRSTEVCDPFAASSLHEPRPMGQLRRDHFRCCASPGRAVHGAQLGEGQHCGRRLAAGRTQPGAPLPDKQPSGKAGIAGSPITL
jgi:hypothetical protein